MNVCVEWELVENVANPVVYTVVVVDGDQQKINKQMPLNGLWNFPPLNWTEFNHKRPPTFN
jgi:hypothetical protein